MNIDLTLDKYFDSKGLVKKHWGGNALIYIKDSSGSLFKSDMFSVVNSRGVLHQVSSGIYFKELTELSYLLFTKINPQFGTFKDKRMVASNVNYLTYSLPQREERNLKFIDDKESSKFEKLINYYEKNIEPFFNKFQTIEDFEYLYENAHKLGESDLLTLLYLSKLYSQEKQAYIIELLNKSYQERLLKEESDEINKSIVMESISNTQKRIELLNEL